MRISSIKSACTQALSAHLVVLILPGFKEFSLNFTGRIISTS